MIREWQFKQAKERKIWIPYMCDSAFPFAAVLRGKGYNAYVLPRSQDSSFSFGRRYTDGDQCLPSIITTEDMLNRVFSQDFQPDREAFFQGSSEGPCRYGRYYMNQLLILKQLGLEDVPVVTLSNKNFYGGLGTDFKLFAWHGILGQGMLERMLHFSRSLEIKKGESEQVYRQSLDEFSRILEASARKKRLFKGKLDIILERHNPEILESLEKSYERFLKIQKRQEKKPLIFITGEIFVRTSDIANQDLVRKIENLGGIALLEPAASFFSYIIATKMERKKYHVRDIGFRDYLKYATDLHFVETDGEKIEDIFHQHDPEAREVITCGSKYLHPTFEGEAIVTLGAADFFAQKVQGIINVMPHNCMPGTICTALSKGLKEKYDIPLLNLSYDGHPDPNREEQTEVFMYQLRERIR